MNGEIAKLVALTCHANAFLRRVPNQPRFFPDNSTCKFVDRISFVEFKRSWFGKIREIVVASTPDDWFKYLANKRASCVRLIYQRGNDPNFPDRMSSAFVGGGGCWMLAVRHRNSIDYWRPRSQVWNRNAPESRIWRVTYGLVESESLSSLVQTDYSKTWSQFVSALTRIHAFSEKQKCDGFTKCFGQAIESLKELHVRHGFHKDLYVPGTLSESSEAMLDAAQSAWVFGGMGSWNDLGFEGEDEKEYNLVSEQLYRALSDAICSAANESDPLAES